MKATHLPTEFHLTIFENVQATKKSTQIWSWSELVANLGSPPVFSSKRDMPLIKLAHFGKERTDKGSLRHDANLQRITGIEGDYDGGVVQPEEAIRRLEKHGIRALVYTTPSHTSEAPRWRVLAPLSGEHEPKHRLKFVSRLNNALGGILANESFTLSQAYYFGRLAGKGYRCLTTFGDPELGTFIDKLDELDQRTGRDWAQTPSEPIVLTATLAAAPLYRSADEIVRHLGRLLRTGDGRRELLKSYIAAKSAQYMLPFEIRKLVEGFIQQYCDPSDPVDGADIERIIEWATNRDAVTRKQLEIDELARTRPREGGAAEELSLSRVFKPSDGLVQVPTTYPPPRTYVFADTVPPRTVCTLAGSGGSSKTMLMLQACVAAASGNKFGPLNVATGSSLLILGEEDAAERDRRIGGICEKLGADHGLVARRMRCFPAAGIDIRLTRAVDQGNPEASELVSEIIELADELSRSSDAPLTMIVLDHARLVLGGDPNDAEDVTQLTRVLTDIAQKTGAAVFLLAHSPKTVISKSAADLSASDIAGSVAFVDNARAAFMLHTMREEDAKRYDLQGNDYREYVSLQNIKANYAATGNQTWFRRVTLPKWGVAILDPVMLFSVSKGSLTTKASLKNRIFEVIKDKSGFYTQRTLRDMAGKDRRLGASESLVRQAITEMLEEGSIVRRPPTADERRTYRLGGQVREVLVTT